VSKVNLFKKEAIMAKHNDHRAKPKKGKKEGHAGKGKKGKGSGSYGGGKRTG
jgi:hypothetical protein